MGRKKKKEITIDMQIHFNDIAMREMHLDYDEDTLRVYDEDTESLLMYGDKFIKYREDESLILRSDELELNLIKNVRIMDTLANNYIMKYAMRNNIDVNGVFQVGNRGTKGYALFTYIENGVTKEYKSDIFINESVRMLNLITKLNKSSHLYNFEELDIVEEL